MEMQKLLRPLIILTVKLTETPMKAEETKKEKEKEKMTATTTKRAMTAKRRGQRQTMRRKSLKMLRSPK